MNGYFTQNTGSITFGPSAATLYTTQSPLVGDDFGVLTIDSTGVSAINGLPSPLPYPYSGSLQFDAGRLYLSNGAVLNATTAAQLGQFFLSPSVPSTGPIVSDSALQKAWMVPAAPLPSSFPDNQVLAFDETTFNQTGSIVVNGNSTTGSSIGVVGLIRWDKTGSHSPLSASSTYCIPLWSKIYPHRPRISRSPFTRRQRRSPVERLTTPSQ